MTSQTPTVTLRSRVLEDGFLSWERQLLPDSVGDVGEDVIRVAPVGKEPTEMAVRAAFVRHSNLVTRLRSGEFVSITRDEGVGEWTLHRLDQRGLHLQSTPFPTPDHFFPSGGSLLELGDGLVVTESPLRDSTTEILRVDADGSSRSIPLADAHGVAFGPGSVTAVEDAWSHPSTGHAWLVLSNYDLERDDDVRTIEPRMLSVVRLDVEADTLHLVWQRPPDRAYEVLGVATGGQVVVAQGVGTRRWVVSVHDGDAAWTSPAFCTETLGPPRFSVVGDEVVTVRQMEDDRLEWTAYPLQPDR